MIKSIYIMMENGVLLYVKHYMTRRQFDENLIVGFFASIANFSREALNSTIHNVDVGQDTKLVFHLNHDEKLLITAVVSSKENDELLKIILQKILQDFINEYAPHYKVDRISNQLMERIVYRNLKSKIKKSTSELLIISWAAILPLSALFLIMGIGINQFLYDTLFGNKVLFSDKELITTYLPRMSLISTLYLIILFLPPNFISGLITARKPVMIFNSIVHILIILGIVAAFFPDDPILLSMIISYLPVVLMISLLSGNIGLKMAGTKRISLST